MTCRQLASLGALGGALGVAAGAVGAHVVHLEPGSKPAHWFETGVLYLLVHAVAVVALGLRVEGRRWQSALGLMLLGMVFFSGGLLASAALELPRPLPVIPWGGTAFIGAWILVALNLLRAPARAPEESA